MNSTKKNAKVAGWLYLLLAITGFYSIMYVPGKLVVFGDATATANNIASSELFFRSGVFVGLVSSIIFVGLAVALYRLLKEINHRQAILMVALVVFSAATGIFCDTHSNGCVDSNKRRRLFVGVRQVTVGCFGLCVPALGKPRRARRSDSMGCLAFPVWASCIPISVHSKNIRRLGDDCRLRLCTE